MRTITTPQRDLLKGDRATFAKVEVKDSDGTWRDLSNLNGADYLVDATWTEDIDQPCASGRFSVIRGSGSGSVAPLVETSDINKDASLAYAPFLNAGRELRISTAVVALGATPAAGDWVEVLQGKLDNVDWATSPVQCQFRDRAGFLADAFVQETRTYGTETGVPAETVAQQILDDNMGAGAYTIVTPVSPGWMITNYTVSGVSVLDALKNLAIQIGWDVRYRYDASGTYALTFFQPDRAKTTPDAVLDADEYLDLTAADISDAEVRNIVRIVFQNSATGAVDSTLSSSAGSIAEFEPRYMEIGNPSTTAIDTRAEAQAMGDAAISDLAIPKLTQTSSLRYWWPVQLGDLLRWTANGVHYTTDQDLAVTGFTHTLAANQVRTTMNVRGTPAGAYKQWILLRNGQYDGQIAHGPFPLVGPLGGEASAFGGGANREGMAWLALKFNADTDHVDIYAAKAPTTPVPTPLLAENQKSWTIVRGDGDTASADDWATWVPVATTTAWYRKLVILPYAADGTRGPTTILEAQCVDSGTGPTAAPTDLVVTSAGDANNITFTANDAAASHLITRNGIVLIEILPGQPSQFTDAHIDPSVPYTYDVFAFRNYQSSAFASAASGTTTTPPATAPSAPTWDSGYPVGVTTSGVATCDFKWHCDATATRIAIELGVALPGSIKWYEVAGFTDAGHIPAGEYVDSSQSLFNTLLARLKQTLPDGSVQYSAAVTAQWGDPPFAQPRLVFAGVNDAGTQTTYTWAVSDSRCTQLDVQITTPPLGSATVWTTIATATTAPTIANGQSVHGVNDGGKVARVVATYPGGVQRNSLPMAIAI